MKTDYQFHSVPESGLEIFDEIRAFSAQKCVDGKPRFVILDEAQNTTPVQMKMFLTRLGQDARMVVTGDLSQIDLPRGTKSGLTDAVDTLSGVEGISFVEFSDVDVVRHTLVGRIIRAYAKITSGRKEDRS
ncbi:MAG: PhoH family protein [Rhodospirillales bacterium]|nr:PhoH family protein [Rhodospirillales bacterium]